MKRLILLATLLLTSCANYYGPMIRDVEKYRVINKPFENVWRAVNEWCANNAIPIDLAVHESGQIKTKEITIQKDTTYCDCGEEYTINNEFKRIEGSHWIMTINLEKVTETETKVHLNTEWWRKKDPRLPKYWDVCVSTGHYEKRLLDFLAK
jgi:hypothetical protein